MGKNIYYLLLCVSLVLTNCTGSKKYAKKAEKLAKAGLYQDAADFYLESLRRNSSNVDARIGLRKNGEKLLDDHLQEFYKAHAMNESKKAVYAYHKAKNYHTLLANYKINLEFPSHYNDLYDESKGSYLSDLYKEGSQLQEDEKYQQAEIKFKEILKFDPHYKNTTSLLNVAKAEPHYKKGLTFYDNENYRQAYVHFDEVTKVDPHYKDVEELKEESLSESMFTIGIMPFENKTRNTSADDRISAHVVSEVSELHNPFIKLVDRENTSKLLEEQKLGLSGVLDEKTAANAGQLLGVKAVLLGKVINYTESSGSLSKDYRKAYEPYKEKRYDKEGKSYYVTKYKQIYYYEYKQQNSVAVSFQYQLISSETGQILITNVVDKTFADKVNYSTYRGNYKNLTPEQRLTGIGFSSVRRNFINKFSARKDVKSTSEISNLLFQKIANTVASDVMKYELSRAN